MPTRRVNKSRVDAGARPWDQPAETEGFPSVALNAGQLPRRQTLCSVYAHYGYGPHCRRVRCHLVDDELVGSNLSKVVRILVLEDVAADADLMAHTLKSTIPHAEYLRVESREAFLVALTAFQPELILCDYKLPAFDGLGALALAKEQSPETPFIVVTGSISEEAAVECMKLGAWDYVLKDGIKRLGPAVVNAFLQKQRRLERRQAEEALRESETRFATAFQRCPVSMSITSAATGQFVEVNEIFLRDSGFTREEMIGHTSEELGVFCDLGDRERLIAQAQNAGHASCREMRFRIKNGEALDALISTQLIQLHGQTHFLSTIIDVTDKKKAERQQSSQLEELQRWQVAVLGREGRVQELKREVNALCSRLGEAVRYPSQERSK